MRDVSKQIINECAKYGVEIDAGDQQLMSFIEGFTTMPSVRKDNDAISFYYYRDGEMRNLQVKRDGKYSCSAGSNVF